MMKGDRTFDMLRISSLSTRNDRYASGESSTRGDLKRRDKEPEHREKKRRGNT